MSNLSLRSPLLCTLLLFLHSALPSHSQTSEAEVTEPQHTPTTTNAECPGIEFNHSVKNTRKGLLFTFQNFNLSKPIEWVDVHYTAINARKLRGLRGRLHEGDEHQHQKKLLEMICEQGELINKRMKSMPLGRQFAAGSQTAAQTFQLLTEPIKPGQAVVYKMTFAHQVQCDVGPFTHTKEDEEESGHMERLRRLRRERLERSEPLPIWWSISREEEGRLGEMASTEEADEIKHQHTQHRSRDSDFDHADHFHSKSQGEEKEWDTKVQFNAKSIYMTEVKVDKLDSDSQQFDTAQEQPLNLTAACPLIRFQHRLVPREELTGEAVSPAAGPRLEFTNLDANQTQLAFILFVFNATTPTPSGVMRIRGTQVFVTSAHRLFGERREEPAEGVVAQSKFTFVLPPLPANSTLNYYFLYGTNTERCMTETFMMKIPGTEEKRLRAREEDDAEWEEGDEVLDEEDSRVEW